MGRIGRLYCCFHKSVTLDTRERTSTDGLVDNGGPAGVLYELLVACFYYGFIAASIAEVRPFTIFWMFDQLFADVPVAHLIHTLRRRRLPLGFRDPRPPLRPRPRILHRLSQLLWLDIRSRLHRIYPLKRSGANVRRVPSRSRHPAMARLRRFHPNHLVLLRARGIREPITASVKSNRVVPCYLWWNYNHHRSRSDAESTCQ